MTGATWMALLSVLLVSVGLSYSAMKKMSAPLPKYTKPEISNTTGRSSELSSVIATEPKKKNDVRNWDALWKESLFKDDRTEVEATADGNAVDAGSQEQVNSEFELVGIARLGRKDASAPVAIILEVKNNARNRQNNRNMPMNRRPGGPGMGGGFPPRGNERPALNKPAETEPENRKANKSLYRIGDKIGSTSYTIKDIVMEENKVILERGGVETVLILDEKNTNNSIRRERVKNEEMAVRAKYAQKAVEKPAKIPAATPVSTPAQPQGNVPNNTPPQRGFPGQNVTPNGIRPGMQQGMQPAQRIMQPVQQNPTSGMPPLPPTVPGGAGNANGTGGTNPASRRGSPVPQRLVD